MEFNIDELIEINGIQVRIIIKKSGLNKSPLFIYISGEQEIPQFGGYVYSIKDGKDRVVQLVIKSGNCEEIAKSLGNLMGKKYDFPNYCNINGIESMDYNFLLMELNQLMKPTGA